MSIKSVKVKSLRPTQMAVGMKLVKFKRKGLRAEEKRPSELLDYILLHPIRVVAGPKDLLFVVDHHHLAHALLDEGFDTAPVDVLHDLSKTSQRNFWGEMEKHKWVYPYDGEGKKQKIGDIPKKILDMEDDPFRSIAGFVRLQGGFEKSMTPYVEFTWAQYFRKNISAKLAKKNFSKALKHAMDLAVGPEAKDLPGYVGKAKTNQKKSSPAK